MRRLPWYGEKVKESSMMPNTQESNQLGYPFLGMVVSDTTTCWTRQCLVTQCLQEYGKGVDYPTICLGWLLNSNAKVGEKLF
jgi:hypothetical protein